MTRKGDMTNKQKKIDEKIFAPRLIRTLLSEHICNYLRIGLDIRGPLGCILNELFNSRNNVFTLVVVVKSLGVPLFGAAKQAQKLKKKNKTPKPKRTAHCE